MTNDIDKEAYSDFVGKPIPPLLQRLHDMGSRIVLSVNGKQSKNMLPLESYDWLEGVCGNHDAIATQSTQ